MIQLIAIITPLLTGYTTIEKPLEPNSVIVAVNYIQSMVGKRIDYDNSYGYQCVDWAQKYISEIHSKNIKQIWTAWNWWKKWIWFEWWTRKKPGINTAPPKSGDIIFMDISGHTKWHVGVVVSATDEYVMVSEQNWWDGKANWRGKNAISVHKRYYNIVLWWFTKQ